LNGTIEYFIADIDYEEVRDISNPYSISSRSLIGFRDYKTSMSTTTYYVHNVWINPFFVSNPGSARYYTLVQLVNCTKRDPGSDGAQRLLISIRYF
jgi:hypothetical protein